jgi:hypothetical protein
MRWARKVPDVKAAGNKRSHGGAVPGQPERASVDAPDADARESTACACAGEGLPLLSEMAGDKMEILALTLLRFVFAGFCCGKVACWNAGMDVAANVLGDDDGALLYSRVLMLGRAIQRERHGNFNFLPGNCCRITEDEIEVLALLKAARNGKPAPIEVALLTLARNGETPRLSAAASSLGRLIASLADAGLPAENHADRTRAVGQVLH